MRPYYSDTNTGMRIVFVDSRDEYVGYDDTSDVFAFSLVVGFVIFLLFIL